MLAHAANPERNNKLAAPRAQCCRSSLLAVAASRSEQFCEEIGRRPVGGDSVSDGNVRLGRRLRGRRLLCDFDRRGCGLNLAGAHRRRGWFALSGCGSRGLGRRGGGRRNRGLDLSRLSGEGRSLGRCSRFTGTEKLGVEVGGGPLTREAVHRLVRLLTLARGGVVRRGTSGKPNRDRGERNRDLAARRKTTQDGFPKDDCPPLTAGYGAGKANGRFGGTPERSAKWRGVRRAYAEPLIYRHQPACKPGSVGHRPLVADDTRRPFLWDNVYTLPRATYPDDEPDIALAALSLLANSPRCRPYSVLLPVWFTMPVPLPVPRCALTAPFHPCLLRREGGSFSVALSLGLPPPEVIRHRMSMEPGLSSPLGLSALAGAAVRPTDG